MQAPRFSRPREPGLYARAPDLERYRVAAGGLTLVALQPGDSLQVIDLEGQQPCELLALTANGRSALPDWELSGSPSCRFIASRLVDGSAQARRVRQALVQRGVAPRQLPAAASLWDDDSPAGYSRHFVAGAELLVIVAAPAGLTSVDRQYRPSELRLWVTRVNPSALLLPALPEPLGELLDEFTLSPGTARSYAVGKGQYVQVLDVAGRQCSDFVALDRRALDRGEELDLDQTVTRTLNGSAYPAPGLFSKFFDRHMQPMLEVVQDTVGRHDSFALACAARYYESHGYFGHDNCSDNLSRVLAPHGVKPRNGWPAINFFFNTGIDAHQQMTLDEPWSRPGDYVLLRAMTDLLCGSTSCPDDIDPANGWNPTDIHVRIYSEKERFSIAMSTRTTADADPILTRESAFHSRTSALTRSFVDYRNWWLPLRYDGYGAIEEYLGCRDHRPRRRSLVAVLPDPRRAAPGGGASGVLGDVSRARRHARRRHLAAPGPGQFSLDWRRRLRRRVAARAGTETRHESLDQVRQRADPQPGRSRPAEPRPAQADDLDGTGPARSAKPGLVPFPGRPDGWA
jgi:aminomethyltransferase